MPKIIPLENFFPFKNVTIWGGYQIRQNTLKLFTIRSKT